MKVSSALVATYILIGIVVFGHSVNLERPECDNLKYEQDASLCNTSSSFMNSMFWPLYISVQMWKEE